MATNLHSHPDWVVGGEASGLGVRTISSVTFLGVTSNVPLYPLVQLLRHEKALLTWPISAAVFHLESICSGPSVLISMGQCSTGSALAVYATCWTPHGCRALYGHSSLKHYLTTAGNVRVLVISCGKWSLRVNPLALGPLGGRLKTRTQALFPLLPPAGWVPTYPINSMAAGVCVDP